MDNKKIGEFIANMRKSKNMTQKDLADCLGVTDKAISKWERGAGYPDIGMLKPLADALGTSINELLEGEASDSPVESNSDNIHNALVYADKIISIKEYKLGKILSTILAVSIFIAIFASVIVNFAVSHNLTWSLIVVVSCIMGGCLLIPPLLEKMRGLYYSLCFLTVLIVPFLWALETLTATTYHGAQWTWGIGLPVSVIWLAILWFMVLINKKWNISVWYNICIVSLLGIPGHIITNYVIGIFVKEDVFSYSRQISYISSVICLLSAAGICFVIGLLRRKPTL